jgi:hypothetical protein
MMWMDAHHVSSRSRPRAEARTPRPPGIELVFAGPKQYQDEMQRMTKLPPPALAQVVKDQRQLIEEQ